MQCETDKLSGITRSQVCVLLAVHRRRWLIRGVDGYCSSHTIIIKSGCLVSGWFWRNQKGSVDAACIVRNRKGVNISVGWFGFRWSPNRGGPFAPARSFGGAGRWRNWHHRFVTQIHWKSRSSSSRFGLSRRLLSVYFKVSIEIGFGADGLAANGAHVRYFSSVLQPVTL